MGFSFNINIKHKITVNGKEYESLDEVPEEQRLTLRGALDSAAPGGSRLVVNGKGYDSPAAMPPEVCKSYEEILKKAEAAARRSGTVLAVPRSGDLKPEGSASGRVLAALAILAGLAMLVKLILAGG